MPAGPPPVRTFTFSNRRKVSMVRSRAHRARPVSYTHLVVDAGQILLFLRPVVKSHGPVRLHMAQKALYVHRHLAPPGRLGEQGPVKVPVHQAGEVVNGGVDGGQVLPRCV